MALTLYCKKCKCDVPSGDSCPLCGGKLNANQLRAHWYIERSPICDWFSWNHIMRIVIPAAAAFFMLIVLLEAVFGGLVSLTVFLPVFASVIIAFLAIISGLTLLLFALRGKDLLSCTVDQRGITVQTLMERPTKLQLLLRWRMPSSYPEPDEQTGPLLISEQMIAWRDVQRVQLWPEKTTVLFYAPRFWLRISLPCTPFSWDDVLGLVSDKLGSKKQVLLPTELVLPETQKAKKKKSSARTTRRSAPRQHDSDISPELLEDIRMMNAEEERRSREQ